MKIALLGATGFVGRLAAPALAGRADVTEVVLVDYDIRAAKKMAKALSPSCRWAMADVGRAPDLERLLGSLDAVASAVGPCERYEKAIFLACAGMNTPVASIGDGTLGPDERREIHDAFRRAGVPAATGCGLMPGWTELLAAHFLGGPGRGSDVATGGPAPPRIRFLFFSPARFGGYAFCRRLAGERLRPCGAPAGAPRGDYFETETGDLVGLPRGRAAALHALAGRIFSPLGGVGTEFCAASRFWLKGSMGAGPGDPPAAAGVVADRGGPPARACVEDVEGRLAGVLLAETAVALARLRGTAKGLVPLPEIISRNDAERIATAGGGRIVLG